MKTILSLAVIIGCSLFCSGQKRDKNVLPENQQIKSAKQAAIDDLESQVKMVSFPVVRTYIRYKLALWLWQNGKDETGDAKVLSIRAFDELYDKKNEFPQYFFSDLSTRFLALFEAYDPGTAKKIHEKYNISKDEQLNSIFPLLDKKDLESLVVDKLLASLENQREISSQAIFILEELAKRKSPGFLRVLSGIVSLEERGKSNFSSDSLFFITDFFRNETVSSDLRMRFYKIVIKKARQALDSDESEALSAFDLINSVSIDISASNEALYSEFNSLKIILASKISRSDTEYREVYERIDDSSDRLEALMSEADATSDKVLKEQLITEASTEALKRKKFQVAIDLTEKLADLKKSQKNEDARFKFRFDQFMGDVAIQSLKDNEIAVSKKASGKISDKLARAEILRKTANYFFEQEDSTAALNTLNESLKITNETENNSKKIAMLLRLLVSFQKIDKDKVSGVSENIAKLIDALPTLNPDDKPGSENHIKYMNSIMAINANLLPVFNELLKKNRLEALNFASRINRKEVKIITGYALTAEMLENLKALQPQAEIKH
jgi:hypothetical protein